MNFYQIGDRVHVISLNLPATIIGFPFGNTHATIRVEGDSIECIARLADLKLLGEVRMTDHV